MSPIRRDTKEISAAAEAAATAAENGVEVGVVREREFLPAATDALASGVQPGDAMT